jgi:hypothetical protein
MMLVGKTQNEHKRYMEGKCETLLTYFFTLLLSDKHLTYAMPKLPRRDSGYITFSSASFTVQIWQGVFSALNSAPLTIAGMPRVIYHASKPSVLTRSPTYRQWQTYFIITTHQYLWMEQNRRVSQQLSTLAQVLIDRVLADSNLQLRYV